MLVESPIFMNRLLLDAKKFVDFACRRRLMQGETEWGYAIHSLLGEIFGTISPKPFFISGQDKRWMTLLFYSDLERSLLLNHARLFADPACYSIVDWERFAQKPLPNEWTLGQRIGFDTRVCPVKRKSGTGGLREKAEVEIDAYLSYLETIRERKEILSRFQVYEEWVRAQCDAALAVRCLQVGVRSFQLVAMQRRNQAREIRSAIRRPEALISGIFEIVSPSAFQAFLRRGIGRHRAFGFGMILLKPVQEEMCFKED